MNAVRNKPPFDAGRAAYLTLNGLLLAIALSVSGLVYRSTRVDIERLGRIPGEKAAYGSTREHGERMIIEGIVSIVLGENPRAIESKLNGFLH